MDKKENHIDELIGKYLSGEASQTERGEVVSWLSEKEANRKYFDQMRFIFDRAASVTETHQFDSDQAWNKVKLKLNSNGHGKTVSFEAKRSFFTQYYKVAAAMLIAIGIGYFVYQFSATETEKIAVVTKNNPEADTLPDGSGVYINKESQLAYEYNARKKTHVVKLKGEAYFNIKHKDDQKFIVETEHVYIRDIGTSFNVKAYPNSNKIEVVVEEGEVIFYSDSDSGVYLKANGKGIYDKVTKKFTVEEPEPNVTAYKTKFFIFSDTDLETVVKTLNDVYPSQIFIGDHLKNCRITATFNNENTDDIANIIAETLGLRVKRSGNVISLEGVACEQ